MTIATQRRIIPALGITQIFAWGSTYYLLAVLGPVIAGDTGWPLPWVMGGLSIGLLVAAGAAPYVGRSIARHGGRPVLALSSLAIAAGLALLGLAHNLVVYAVAWMLIGLGMSAGLYDAAFATLTRYYGSGARRAITLLTLWGGFASTVCWPLSALLVDHLGWRNACFAYALAQAVLSLPILLGFLPPVADNGETHGTQSHALRLSGSEIITAALFGAIQTLGSAVTTLISVFLLTLLQSRGVTPTTAVALGALVGPCQVGGRLIEMALGRNYHPYWTLVGAASLIALGLLLLLAHLPLPGLALMLYGAGNGVWSIARGTVPLAVFGPERYPVLMGRLATPALLAQASMPLLGGWVLASAGADWALIVVGGMAAMNVALVALLWTRMPRAVAA